MHIIYNKQNILLVTRNINIHISIGNIYHDNYFIKEYSSLLLEK